MPPISNVHIIYPPVRVGSLKCSLPTEEDEETLSYTRRTAAHRWLAPLTCSTCAVFTHQESRAAGGGRISDNRSCRRG